ncbi:hypothetical protein [Sporosarcina psychrophila]|uniref:DNA replication protein DnaD n=1 Tax=Sporosarcina psychrophila TaxID=1476 RepID=A0ABV2KC81_SPOPS
MEFMKFIMINNQLIIENEENEFQLTPQELYVYSLVSMSRDCRAEIYISASLIHAKSHIALASDKKRAVKIIKESLISLKDKQVIRFATVDGEVTNNFKVNDILIVQLVDFETIDHTQLWFDVFAKTNDIYHLYVFLAVRKWLGSGDGVFTCSQERWSRILQCSQRHAVDLVNGAVEAGLIYKNIGDYNETGKQNVNQYRTTPFKDDEITHHSFKKKYIEKEIEEETDLKHFNVEKLNETEQRFTTFKDENGKDVFPNETDHIVLLDLKKKKKEFGLTDFEKRVLRAGENRIKKLKKQEHLVDENGNPYKMIDRVIEQAKLAIEYRDEH